MLDAGYKMPAIAKILIDDHINPIFPYKRPMTKEVFFLKMNTCMMNFITVIYVLITKS